MKKIIILSRKPTSTFLFLKETIVDEKTIQQLERLALLNFNNTAGIQQLSEAIRLADQIRTVDTTGVEPMDSVLEDR